jgi:hypothetical protein
MTMLSAGIINESGGGTGVIEDWEGSNPLSNWSGDTGSFGVQGSTVYEGSNAVEWTSGGEDSITKDGLTVAPADTPVSGYFWNDSSTDEAGMVFGAQSTAGNSSLDCYETWTTSGGGLVLDRQFDGGEARLTSATGLDTTDGWTKLTVDWQSDGTISVTLTGTAGGTTTISATDSTYTSGRIGVMLDGTNYADYLYYGT